MPRKPRSQFHRSESSRGFHFINLYQCCPRKFYLRYIKGWKPRFTAQPLIFGGAFHEGTAHYYKTGDEGASIALAMSYIEDARSEIATDDIYDDISFRLPNLLHYWIEKRGSLDRLQYKFLYIEKELTVPISDTPYSMTIRPDAIAQDLNNDLIYIIERKTSSFSIRVTGDALYYGDQATTYWWGVQKALKLEPYAVLPDIAYWNARSRDLNNMQFSNDKLVFRTPYQLQLYESSMKQLFLEVTQKSNAVLNQGYDPDVLFPRNSYYCLSFSHPCEYADVCSLDCKAMKRVPSDFVRKRRPTSLGKPCDDPIGVV